MEKIIRFGVWSWHDLDYGDPDGELMCYEDHCEAMEAQRANHLAIVEKLKAEIEDWKQQARDNYAEFSEMSDHD